MKQSYVVIFAILCLFALAGCMEPVGTDLQWRVDADVHEVDETNSGIEVRGTVNLEGMWSDQLKIENVSVCALDQSGDAMDRVSIGTVTDDRPPTNYTLTVPQQPEIIALGYGEIETEGEGEFIGGKLNEEGLYAPFYQDRPRCNSS